MKRFLVTTVVAYVPKLLLLASLAYPIFVFSIFPRWLIDDAYIHFRYAENLAFHGELNWNVGEDPVEGYTSVAWPVLLSGAAKAGLPLASSARAIGIVSFFASWFLFLLILRRLKIREDVQGAVLLLFSTLPVLFTHATSGLETVLFLAGILLSVYAFLASVGWGAGGYSRGNVVLFFASLLLLSFIRPEGVALAGFFSVAAGYVVFRYHRQEFRSFLILFLCFYFAPALIYFLWRYFYYGVLLPNTFYVKATGFFYDTNLVVAQRFLRKFFAVPVLLSLLLVAPEADLLWQQFKRKVWPLPPRFEGAALALLIFAGVIAFEISFSHLLTDFSGRFYVPLFPLFWIGFAVSWHIGLSAVATTRQEKPIRYRFLLFVFGALVLYQAAFHAVKLREELTFASQEKLFRESQHVAAGQLLRELLPSSEWLVVYLDAGAVPYFSKLPTVDFGGLNDIFLARAHPTLQQKIDYFFSKNPGVLSISSESLQRIDYGEEIDAIARDARFSNYVLYKKYPSPISYLPYHQFLYLRKDIYARLAKEGKI